MLLQRYCSLPQVVALAVAPVYTITLPLFTVNPVVQMANYSAYMQVCVTFGIAGSVFAGKF
jgi:hypothetical protein